MVGAALFARLLEEEGVRVSVITIKLIEALANPEITDYFKMYLCSARLTDEDYKIYIKGKPEILREEIKRRLPNWLKDKADAFL